MFESLDGHLKERSNNWSHMLGTQIPSIQGFGDSNFHIYDAEIWGGDLKKSHWRVFEKGIEVHMMFHVKVCVLDNLPYFVG
jgi:hypothetical protein